MHKALQLTVGTVFLATCLSLISHLAGVAWLPGLRTTLSRPCSPSKPTSDKFKSLTFRLQQARPKIQQILDFSGAAGLSYGIIHRGQVVHTENFGYRDFRGQLPIDDKTIFPICSMTKAFTSALLGILVDDAILTWDTKVTNILPNFIPRSPTLQGQATIADFLSMRSGLQETDTWLQSQNDIIFPETRSIDIINNFRQLNALGENWDYSNYAYELLGQVITNSSSQPWSSLLSSHILGPLNMSRTTTDQDLADFDNIALAYMSLDDATPIAIDNVKVSGRSLMGPAVSVKSCIRDLLTFYQAFLRAFLDQSRSGRTSTAGSPFKQLVTIVSPHANLPKEKDYHDSSYAFGWFRSRLPGAMCQIGSNRGRIGGMPVVGHGSSPRTIISHYGSMPGALSSVNLFPDTESAIIVLTNTLSLSDNADWVSQLLIQELFDFEHKNDYLCWTKKTIEAELAWHGQVVTKLEKQRTPGTSHKPLQDYTGIYEDSIGCLRIYILQKGNNLKLNFQGLEQETFALHHYEYDIFTWLSSRNSLAARGRYTGQDAQYYKIRFIANDMGFVTSLFWSHDESEEGEQFNKVSPEANDGLQAVL